jgi:adenylyl- and sulfurtransferase ThiI
MKDEALKLALEALETELAVDMTNGAEVGEAAELMCEAITAIKQALAAPVQEPVAWTVKGSVADWSKDFSKYQTQHYTRPVYTTPPAQPAPVKVWEAEGYDALMQEMQMVKARNIRQHAEIERLKAAQPAVPDAFGTREGEHPQYIQGWNDCRQAMMEMKK